jgi:hypothetical protein
MGRGWLVSLSTMILALAVVPAASADRVLDVRGADAAGSARYDRVRVIHGRDLDVPIYAIESSLGAGRVLAGARALARRSRVPHLRLVDRHDTYDHVDPLSATAPGNAFVRTVVPFLRRVG